MADNEFGPDTLLRDRDPDKLQQLLNRLHKCYEHQSSEDCRQQMFKDIEEMDVSEPDRQELLRRIG